MDLSLLSVIISGLSLVAAAVAVVISLSSARSARRSASASEAIQRVEEARRPEELQATHDQLAPGYPAARFFMKDGTGGSSLFAEITLPRTYRVQAEGWIGNSYSQLAGLPLLAHGGRPYTVHIEHWPQDRRQPRTEEIRLKLWPPVKDADDNSHVWQCPCGRPTGETATGPGHWEVRIPVVYEPPPEPFVAYGP